MKKIQDMTRSELEKEAIDSRKWGKIAAWFNLICTIILLFVLIFGMVRSW